MAWSDIFLPSSSQTADEQQAAIARQQQQLADAYARRQADGTATDASALAAQDNSGGYSSQNAAALQGFGEGLAEGWNNVLNAPGKAVGWTGGSIGQLLWGVIKNIPWWAWLVGLGALFVWMGGLELLRGRLGKYAK